MTKKSTIGQLLTKNEMKNFKGGATGAAGGTCASINAYGEVMYNQTQTQASGVGAGGHWCCKSCSSASWFTGCGEFGC
jgi:hypothetical protein